MGLFDRLMQPQAAPRRNLMETQMVRRPSESYLRQDYPTVYGALGGLFGTAPDQFQGSVLDPNTAAVRRGAEYGFPVGTALGMLPVAPVAQRGAMVVGRAGERLAERAVPQVMERGGLLAEMMQGMGRGTVSPLDVYHGTPHTLPPTPRNPLGEFDASKIGTGEGAQSYGLGIYTAENPVVATGYRDKLQNVNYSGSEIDPSNPSHVALATVEQFGNKEKASAYLKQRANLMDYDINMQAAKLLDEGATLPIRNATGNLYKVDLPDEKIAQMIDYDKPMAEQRNLIEKMRKALVGPDSPLSRVKQFEINETLNDSVRMRNLYPQSIINLNEPQIVERLRQAGIPGIKYFDEGSRGAETSKQTRNFVTFPGEEQNLKILERNNQRANELDYPSNPMYTDPLGYSIR